MTPLVVENGPAVTSLRRKTTGVDFRWESIFVVTVWLCSARLEASSGKDLLHFFYKDRGPTTNQCGEVKMIITKRCKPKVMKIVYEKKYTERK